MNSTYSLLTSKLYSLLHTLFFTILHTPLGNIMTSILRQIIAGPRVKHQESNLDLCYVTPFLIATSGPSGTYPQRAYRNPLDQLVKFLDKTHGEEWCIWEFRAEGTGYPDEEVRGKVRHYPWPDHHPPPFAVVPLVMAGMRNWLLEGTDNTDAHHERHHLGKLLGEKLDAKHSKGRVVVVHCKAGKGRSGTMASSYLISECGWTKEQALQRFTERRMRPGFGEGVSIPSQLRWVDYVTRWTAGGKTYTSRPVEILEIHVWGLREGVKVAIESFVEDGKKIKTFHVFKRGERKVVEGNTPGGSGFIDYIKDMADPQPAPPAKSRTVAMDGSMDQMKAKIPLQNVTDNKEDQDDEAGGSAVLFIPSEPLIIPSSDINIDFERRNKARYGMTMVTSVAHVWFNTFFEGNGPEQNGVPDESGTFDIEWEKMDGIKGSLRKGTKALDRLSVVWRFAGSRRNSVVVNEPARDEEVPEMQAADWKGGNEEAPGLGKNLGLRKESPVSADVSKANSMTSKVEEEEEEGDDQSVNMVKASGPDGEDLRGTGGTEPPSRSDSPAPLVGSVPTQQAVDEGLNTASSTTPNRGDTT